MANTFQYKDYPFIIGIDFGTTYSGASFCFTHDNEINDIVRWPGQPDYSYPKCPTVCLYDRETNNLVQWGRSAKSGKPKFQNLSHYTILQQFKLYLDDSLEGLVRQLPLGLNITDVIADYLRKFFDYIVAEISKKGFYQDLKRQSRFCLTVPAMWSDKSKQIMREAAIKANIISTSDHTDRLMLISEPEAAALYCEKTCDRFNMVNKDEFMVCDAGGGTVDLIVFRVEMDENGNRKFRESTKGLGESCGSTFIDRGFRKVLRKKLKRVIKRSVSTGAIEIPEAPLEHMLDTFIDNIKPQFDGTEDSYINVSMGFDLMTKTEASIGLDEGIMAFTASELKRDVFDPVVEKVIQLCIDLQNDTSNLKAIFLVGGFGSSPYLYNEMKKVFDSKKVHVIQPERPEMAVARGAVIFGMNPTKVATRIPRHWYGIEITNVFEPELDPEEYKIYRPDGSVRCDNRFSTYVERGKPLDIDSCVSRVYTTYYPQHTACTFYMSDSETEPRYTIPSIKNRIRKNHCVLN
ncbi:actin-like ATPase domain-containing protein [Backusella circina FSU 941]|nr:actin-like ATPase domain-containing protein [Backusella circina FSU 941]